MHFLSVRALRILEVGVIYFNFYNSDYRNAHLCRNVVGDLIQHRTDNIIFIVATGSIPSLLGSYIKPLHTAI